MIRAMLWKEFREQGLIAATLLVLGSGILVAAAMFGDPPATGRTVSPLQLLGTGGMAALMLAVTAGMVCGGALFAAEREAGTIGFLESLPATRWEVWRAKLICGTVLAVVQVGVVLLVAAILGVAPRDFAVRVALYAALAFVWGAFGSTLSRTTLGAVGIAIPSALLAMFVVLIPITLFFVNPGSNTPRPEGEVLFIAFMVGLPLVLSVLAYTKADRDRDAAEVIRWATAPERGGLRAPEPARVRAALQEAEAPVRHARRGGIRFGVSALLWMSVKQLVGLGIVLSLFAAAFGMTLLAPGSKPVLMWPSLALAAGVLAGATVFADEQTSQNSRFWGDWRLPIGRMWVVKLCVHFGLALWLMFLVALPLIVRAQLAVPTTASRGQSFLSSVFGTRLMEELQQHSWKFLFMPVVYGFAAGHLCGMLFKKVVVGVGVAALVGGTAAALWVPSLLAGGVWHWQIWLPPAAALVTARLLLRAWASNRLATRRPIYTLSAGVVAVFLLVGVGLGYRVLEIPDNPRGDDDTAFAAALPILEENATGRDFRTAAERFTQFESRAASEFTFSAPKPVVGTPRLPGVEDLLDRVGVDGLPELQADLFAKFIDQVYAQDEADGVEVQTWYGLAAKAAGQRTGLYEDPRLIGTVPSLVALENARRMANAVIARGLLRQSAGDHGEFIRSLRVCLALARSVRNGSVVAALNTSMAIEKAAVIVPLQQWLEKFDGPPELLREALAVLRQNDTAEPFDSAPFALAERYVLREIMKAPAQWVPDLIAAGKSKEEANAEGDFVGFAWTVPWERERTRRLVGVGFEGPSGSYPLGWLRGRPGRGMMIGRLMNTGDLSEFDRQVRAARRAAVVLVAVRLFEAERGRPPAQLDELVAANLLPEVPADPYGQGPLRYRVATRVEALGMPSSDINASGGRPLPNAYRLKPGQGLVWSIGPNGTDEGGRQMPYTPVVVLRIDDLVFPVPPRKDK